MVNGGGLTGLIWLQHWSAGSFKKSWILKSAIKSLLIVSVDKQEVDYFKSAELIMLWLT